MPPASPDIWVDLASKYGPVVSMLLGALWIVYKLYQKALEDKEKAYQLVMSKQDEAHQIVLTQITQANDRVIADKDRQITDWRADYGNLRNGYLRVLGSLERQVDVQERLVDVAQKTTTLAVEAKASGGGGGGA